MDITQELIKDITITTEAIIAAMIAQREHAADAAARGEEVVKDAVKAAKDAIEAIPNIPAFAKGLLESDALLVPLATNLAVMIENTLGAALDKLEGKV